MCGLTTRGVFTCYLITTDPNKLVQDYRHCMPTLRPARPELAGLGHDASEKELKGMLRLYPAEVMTARLANPAVNKVTVEGPECLKLPGC